MTSLMEAVAICRARGELPSSGAISVRDLLSRYRPSPPWSVRALILEMLRIDVNVRWGIVIVTVKDVPRMTTLPNSWYDQLFNDGEGVAPFYRIASGGRQIFSWRVFGPCDMYDAAKKAELAAQGAAAESAYLRIQAADKGVRLADFDRIVWVMDQPASGGTVGGGDLFVAAADITMQITCHEIAHGIGGASEGDAYVNGVLMTYGDSFCPMDRGPSARSFQNDRLEYGADGHNHKTAGPMLCVAHLAVAGWLDYGNNVIERPALPSDELIVIEANLGAPPPGSARKTALTIGGHPGQPQFWVEYRAPEGFDKWVDRATSTTVIDLPDGALVMHELRSDNHVILVAFASAAFGSRIAIPGTRLAVEIANITRSPSMLSVRIRPL